MKRSNTLVRYALVAISSIFIAIIILTLLGSMKGKSRSLTQYIVGQSYPLITGYDEIKADIIISRVSFPWIYGDLTIKLPEGGILIGIQRYGITPDLCEFTLTYKVGRTSQAITWKKCMKTDMQYSDEVSIENIHIQDG